jgi:hypothetical protein
MLSGAVTGGSWLSHFRALKLGDAARVVPIEKLRVVLVAVIATAFLGGASVGDQLAGGRADRGEGCAGCAEITSNCGFLCDKAENCQERARY